MNRQILQIQKVAAYIEALEPENRGIALTALEILGASFGDLFSECQASLQTSTATLKDHEDRITLLEAKVKRLEAERGVLCH